MGFNLVGPGLTRHEDSRSLTQGSQLIGPLEEGQGIDAGIFYFDIGKIGFNGFQRGDVYRIDLFFIHPRRNGRSILSDGDPINIQEKYRIKGDSLRIRGGFNFYASLGRRLGNPVKVGGILVDLYGKGFLVLELNIGLVILWGCFVGRSIRRIRGLIVRGIILNLMGTAYNDQRQHG